MQLTVITTWCVWWKNPKQAIRLSQKYWYATPSKQTKKVILISNA